MALVTGAFGALGRATVQGLAAAGWPACASTTRPPPWPPWRAPSPNSGASTPSSTSPAASPGRPSPVAAPPPGAASTRPRGRIVNVGAAAAGRAGKGMGAYTAAKSGVLRLTEALAEELKDGRATVNAVLPSILDTPANRAEMGEADAGRWVRPEALAGVIAFLLSEAGAPIHGAAVPVTGRV
ncbi:SDR family NAD(P)-dependent oxidoreductase [Piscinibacter sakaiensis]|uniref:SDR family NAD(P)-dependent oxidoreductase n=1 Tax=Piscinibacter sakaiensis TaxID=1547922 RepID=UPI00372CF1CB